MDFGVAAHILPWFSVHQCDLMAMARLGNAHRLRVFEFARTPAGPLPGHRERNGGWQTRNWGSMAMSLLPLEPFIRLGDFLERGHRRSQDGSRWWVLHPRSGAGKAYTRAGMRREQRCLPLSGGRGSYVAGNVALMDRSLPVAGFFPSTTKLDLVR